MNWDMLWGPKKYYYTGVKVSGAENTFEGHLIDGADTGIWNRRNLRK